MDAPYITSEAQWDAFLAEFYPRLNKKIQAEATTVDSVEVYAPADYDEFAKRVKSLPARFDFQGVKKTVLVPLEILSRDAKAAADKAEQATKNADNATAKAKEATDLANQAAARAETAFDDLDQIKGETLAARDSANDSANKADIAAAGANATNELVKAQEEARKTAEEQRAAAEILRQTAETARADAERLRAEAEVLRKQAEDKRQVAYLLLDTFLSNLPKIENGTWRIYSPTDKAYIDTGVDALGHSPYIDEETRNWIVWDEAEGAYKDSGINAETPDLLPIDTEAFTELWDSIEPEKVSPEEGDTDNADNQQDTKKGEKLQS